jgi:hypothetical protein
MSERERSAKEIRKVLKKQTTTENAPESLTGRKLSGGNPPGNFRRHHSALSLLIGCLACKTQKIEENTEE